MSRSDAPGLSRGRDSRLDDLGRWLRLVREKVFRESLVEFKERLGVSKATLLKMEHGHPGVAIGTWMNALQLMQVDRAVVAAASPESLLFAAQAVSAAGPGPAGVRARHMKR
jgi:hypothetical protein